MCLFVQVKEQYNRHYENMKKRIVKEILTIIIVLLLWLPLVVGKPIRCSLLRNIVRYYPDDPGAKKECIPCPDCPEGQGLSPQCGSRVSNYTKIECKPCHVNKTYSNSHGIQSCLPCNECGLKNVLQPCTQYKNRICGKDCPEGYFLNDNEDCQAEATSNPTATKSTIPNDPADMTEVKMKTQVYNATATSAKHSSVGGKTVTSSLDIKTPVTPATNYSTNSPTSPTPQEKGHKYQRAFIATVTVLPVVVIVAILLIICLVIRSRRESAECGGARSENEPLSSYELEESDSSTLQGSDILETNVAKPNVEQIPTDYRVSAMEWLCDHDNQPMLFYVKRELDPVETLTRKTWWSVGLALKVSPKVLDLIEADYKADRSPTESLIRKLKTLPKEPTMREFVQALVNCERNEMANYICNWSWEDQPSMVHHTA